MASYSTDFSEYTTGNQPSDWTERYHTGDATAIVRADASAEGGKLLRVDHSAPERYAVSWDDVGSVSDVEVLAKIRWSDNLAGVAKVYLRGSGGSADECGYFVDIDQINNQVKLYKYVSGAVTQIGSTVKKVFFEDVWYLVRIRVNSTSIKVKIWVSSGTEPTSWMFDETDSSLSSGWVGLGPFCGDAGDCDWFGVATNGGSVSKTFISSSVFAGFFLVL